MTRPAHPHLAILTIGLGSWLFFLSSGITNIALPYLTKELNVAEADVVWVSVAFQISAVSFTIPLAALAERIGVKTMYIGGLLVFALGSLTCALAENFTQLTFARILQGLGAAGIGSVSSALVRRCTQENMVGRVVGMLGVVVGAAQGAAPIIGSFILTVGGWRWLSLYDLPLTAATIALALCAIPKDEDFRPDFDFGSAFLTALTLGTGFFALDRIARSPDNGMTLGLVALAVLGAVLLIRRQRGRERPLFPTDLLRLPHFALSGLIAALAYAAQGVTLTILPFLLVSSLNMTLLEAGTLISILPLATVVTAPITGILCDRYPDWPLSMIGCLLMSLGLFVMGGYGPTLGQDAMSWLMGMQGVGFALFQNHNAKAMIMGAPLRRIGAAGGLQSTMRVIGMTVGPAVVGICFLSFGQDAVTIAILIAGVLCLLAAILALVVVLLPAHSDPPPN